MPVTGNTTQSTSSDLTTDTGGIHATVTWEPKQLKAGRQSTVHINFSDAFSGEPLLANVLYNMSILDSNGTEVLRMDNLTAINATDSRAVSFPADAIYQIEVNVKGIIRDDQGSSRYHPKRYCQRLRSCTRILFPFVQPGSSRGHNFGTHIRGTISPWQKEIFIK